MENKEDEKIRNRVRRIRNFYSSLLTFVGVNILLLVINFIFMPRDLWFYWVTIVWGVIILIQAINTFTIKNEFLGQEWEERKIKELKAKAKKKD